MTMTRTSGRWVTPQGIVHGECHHDTRVHALKASPDAEHVPLFLPAPVDLHVHGGGGHDVMQGEAALRGVLAAQARTGCGAMLATSVAAPLEAIDAFLTSVAAVMTNPDDGSARLLGAHLEGPFINPDKLGAQPPHACALDLVRLEGWLASGVVKVITYAPEIDVDGVVPGLCARCGTRAQIGHTLCDWWCARAALVAGAGVTHLWNAMSGAAHRDGGAALAALAYAEHAEIIADGIHVDKAAFQAARRAIPKLYTVTDGTAAVGMPDGEYRLGEHRVTRRGPRVTLADGTLAGSCLDQCRQLRVLRGWGVGWEAIARLCSEVPAAWIDAAGLGVIEPGAHADWLEVDDRGTPRAVARWQNGRRFALQELVA